MNRNYNLKCNLIRIMQVWDMTQQEFAQALGLSRNVVANWLNERSEMQMSQVILLSYMTGIPVDDLCSRVVEHADISAHPIPPYNHFTAIIQRLEAVEQALEIAKN